MCICMHAYVCVCVSVTDCMCAWVCECMHVYVPTKAYSTNFKVESNQRRLKTFSFFLSLCCCCCFDFVFLHNNNALVFMQVCWSALVEGFCNSCQLDLYGYSVKYLTCLHWLKHTLHLWLALIYMIIVLCIISPSHDQVLLSVSPSHKLPW